ncbi:DEAD/DEAH box helicase family protein [Streptomyces bohaiensis]|uniref:DEAD/DEAH box helicase n=1 Tax=Streptomyces bohaiensis TaxID=1431344 RepID=UPI003B81FDEA
MTAVPAFTPRPYQTEAIQALRSGWTPERTRLAVVLPTGAGKTVILANLISEHRPTLPPGRRRVLVIAHRQELIAQAAAKIAAVNPTLSVGIVKAEQDDVRADIVVASIQTLASERRRARVRDVGLVIVDECHHAAADSYLTVLRNFGAWDGVPVAGFTATMTRTDGGLADVWQDVVFTLDILDLIEAGHLVDVKGKRVRIDGLDLSKVRTRGGDFVDGQLGRALDEAGAPAVVATAYQEFAPGRPGVVFTPTVDSAHHMTEALVAAGIPAATVWGDMPATDRTATLRRYRAGDLQVLTNCMVLTEGFDAPHTEVAVVARPTKSPGLYCQMVGRALRLSPETGKTDALVLDVMGASSKHKLASIVDLTNADIEALPEDDERDLTTIVRAARDAEAAAAAARQAEWEDIELFSSSQTRWLRTEGGRWFIPLKGGEFLFLIPGAAPGAVRVRRWIAGRGAAAPTPDPDMTRADAMTWAETQARRLAPVALLRRTAAWRQRQPSPKQLGWCRARRLAIPAQATAGDLSDLQDLHRVGQLVDQH